MRFEALLFWHWWVAALVLLSLEAFFPGAIFLWMGVSAAVVGALAWVLPIGWQTQIVLFGALSIVSFFIYRRLRPAAAETSDEPTLNRRGHSYIGRRLTLSEPIVNGVGRIHVDDSQWRISGPDLPTGTSVRVASVDGATLLVEPAPPSGSRP